MQLARIQVFHDVTILLAQFLEGFEIVEFQEIGKCSVLQENRFLINLEVRIRLPQIVHLHNQELVASLAHLVLDLLDLWFDLLKADGVLAYCLGWMLHVEDHIVQLVDLLDVLIEVLVNVCVEKVLDHVLGQKRVVDVVLEQLVQRSLVGQVEALALVLQVAHFV